MNLENADNMGNNVDYVFTLLLVVEIKDKLQKRIISTVLYLYIVLKALLLFFIPRINSFQMSFTKHSFLFYLFH